MKKFLLTLILLLGLSWFTPIKAQSTVTHRNWKVENEGQWGSFYWTVVRTKYRDVNGKYWYYVYSASNSLFNSKTNGSYDRAITYVRNVNIFMDEYKKLPNGTLQYFNTVTVNLSHFTCDYKVDQNHYIAYFWSYREYNDFRLTFDKATPYDKSYN